MKSKKNLGFYYGDDDEDEYNESTVKEGRGDLDSYRKSNSDMANEDGITPKEAALEVIEAIRDAYIIRCLRWWNRRKSKPRSI